MTEYENELLTRIAGLECLLKEKDEALLIASAYPATDADNEIIQKALSHTSPDDALERYRKEVLAEYGNIFSRMASQKE